MRARERVMAALSHHTPDRIPRDLGGTTATGMNVTAYRRLIEYMGLSEEVALSSQRATIANISETVLSRFSIDTRGVIPRGTVDLGERNSDGTFTDGYGVVRALPREGGHWYVMKSPLSGDISRNDIAAAAKGWRRSVGIPSIEGLAESLAELHKNTQCAVILNLPLGSVQTTQAIRGFQDWLIDVANAPNLVAYLLETFLEHWLEITSRLLDAARGNVDVIFFADDVAFQNGPMVSPRSYKQLILPYQRRVFRCLHDWSSAKIVYHCCGSVIWLIDNLIDMGVDALNPLQVSADGMADTASIKQRYGDRIAFWGGIDTSKVLPRGGPADVRAEVRRRIGDLAAEGGYVLAAVHNIQGDVPPENVCAMWETDPTQ